MKRELQAWIGQRLVGHLYDDNGIWSFRYADDWDEYDLCPTLARQNRLVVDGSSQRPVQWYFDNLLPEEGQRQLLAGDARLDANDAFALLAHYGAESAGSLTLLPPGQRQPQGGLHPLGDADLSRRIEAMPRLPLTHEAHKRMSLAGAQHKLAVVLDQGALYEPLGAWPSTHILKPDHPEQDFAHSVINEWFTMRLAARVGLAVPAVSRRYVPQPVYLIERFDRQQQGATWQRLHSIDACQMLGLDRNFKYQAGSIERLVELLRLTTSSAVARTRLFGWLVFNVLVGNTDAHLKNLSFLVTGRGQQLAPFYDLLCTAVYETRAFDQQRWPHATTLAWPILGALPQGPSPHLLERLSHLLFLYVLREQGRNADDLGGLLGLARHPQFMVLLEALIATPEQAWTLERMAEMTGLSRSAFCKRFQELAGTSPGHLLLNLRMRQACQLLRQGQPVAATADACGYQSLAAFTRAFAKVNGVLPGAYRKQFASGV